MATRVRLVKNKKTGKLDPETVQIPRRPKGLLSVMADFSVPRSLEAQTDAILAAACERAAIDDAEASLKGEILTRDNTVAYATVHMTRVLLSLGIDLRDPNFKDTPTRFVRYLQEYLHTDQKAEAILKTGFEHTEHPYRGIVAQGNIPFRTICPHHLLPVVGKVHLGYIPGNKLVGLSKLTRVVNAVGTEKPRMQEEITDILADMLFNELGAEGSICVCSAEHMCMSGRGVAAYEVPTITSSVRGLFRDNSAARGEFFELIKATHIK